MAKETNQPPLSHLTRFVTAIDRVYGSWGYLMWRSFISGFFAALGATVGLTIFFTLLGYVLKWLGVLPGIGEWFEQANTLLNRAAGI